MHARPVEITTTEGRTAHGRLHTTERRPPMSVRRATGSLAALLLATGCLGEPAPELGRSQAEALVSDYHTTGCSTSVVLGLSMQIAEEVSCMMPGAFESFEEGGNIVFAGSAVIPFLTPQAKANLLDAAANGGRQIRITSGYRTVVQQYLLRAWYLRGRCGITAAATPGRSNHESGRALDVSNYGELSSIFPSNGWYQTVPGDPVHFDHTASPDLRGYDVLGFQRLWNRNNPGDPITEDGQYGPETEARVMQSPAEGFPLGACPMDQYDGALVAVDAPARMEPGDLAEVVIEIENTGGAPWRPDATFLGTTDPEDRDSRFYDRETWYAPNRPASVEAETAPGEIGVFRFQLRAPELEDPEILSESFGLVEETIAWFGPGDVSFDVVVGDADDPDLPVPDEPGRDLQGGCAVGGKAGAPAMLALLGLLFRRRRRAPG